MLTRGVRWSVGVAALAFTVACGHSSARGLAAPPQIVVPGRPAFPSPPAGAVVFSREMGPDVLALGVVRQGRQTVAQVSVLGGQGEGVRHLAVSVNGRRAAAAGAGVYRTTVDRRAIVVSVDNGPAPLRWRVVVPARTPDATATVAHAARVWRALTGVTFREHLASDAKHAVETTWRVEAPDRVSYDIDGGWSARIVGERRWDRPPGGAWKESAQTRLHQPVPSWVSAVDVRRLGTTHVHGKRALRISFFDPGSAAWFDVAIDPRSFRTLRTFMRTTAHFMDDVYGPFDGPRSIVAPSS